MSSFRYLYGPMVYTAPYVMVLMRAAPLRGQVGGGWTLEIKTFLGPACEMASSLAGECQIKLYDKYK
jgi:hypothetical protein